MHADIECDRESRIANSFADYLAKLQIDVDDEYVLEGAEIDEVKAGLSLLLGASFDPPDTWAHGYPIHRASLGTENNPQWVWISPNTVPRGFVRRDDPRYAELKDLMPGYASRFPELTAGNCILSATDGVRSKVIQACAGAGLAVRPLREFVNSV
jgi:hypothetical protein